MFQQFESYDTGSSALISRDIFTYLFLLSIYSLISPHIHPLWRTTLDCTISRMEWYSIFLITFVIPLLLLCYLYSRICMKIWKHQMPGNADVIRDYNQQVVRVKVRMMVGSGATKCPLSWKFSIRFSWWICPTSHRYNMHITLSLLPQHTISNWLSCCPNLHHLFLS